MFCYYLRSILIVTVIIYSWLSRCSIARGSNSRLSQEVPTKVKARNSFLFAAGFYKVENTEHLIDFVVTLFFS